MGWLWTTPSKPKNVEEVFQKEVDEAKKAAPGHGPGPADGHGAPVGGPRAQIPQQPPREIKFSGFDASSYERAAKAIKEIDRSKNAKEVLDLTLKQEETKQMESKAKTKEFELAIRQEDTQKMRVMEEEKRKTLKEQQRFNQQTETFKDRLARKRHDDQLANDKSNNEEILRRQEESVKQQELMRRQTAEFQEKLRHENELKAIQAKARGRAKAARDNHDLTKELSSLDWKQRRQMALEVLNSAGALVASGYEKVSSSKEGIVKVGAVIGTIALSWFGCKYSVTTVYRFVNNRIGKPKLVRETSRALAKNPVKTFWDWKAGRVDALQGVVTAPRLESRLKTLAEATYFTKKNGGMYRNLMMYGPPGTGKTLFAKKLAERSRMDYAIVTGGDIAPMGKEGVTALHKLFDWGATSKRGMLLFVDEADAFLRKRTDTSMSEEMRSTLNAFLYRTGESSSNVMLVLATNRPDHLDWAINDRIDEMVEFPLPGVEEREQLLNMYYEKYVSDPIAKGQIEWEEFDVASTLKELAEICDGFSGREISKLGIALQASAFASPDKTFRKEMLFTRLQESKAANAQKKVWRRQEGIEGLQLD